MHVIFREKGPEAAHDLFTGIQMVVNFWLFHDGFSIGISNTMSGPKVMSYITVVNPGKTRGAAAHWLLSPLVNPPPR